MLVRVEPKQPTMYANIEDQRKAGRKHYRENKEYYLDRNRRRKDEIRNFIKEHKKDLKCSRCPESDLRCIDFHHLDPSKKLFSIGEAVNRQLSLKRILEEMEKCIPICSNCHRKETLPSGAIGSADGSEP